MAPLTTLFPLRVLWNEPPPTEAGLSVVGDGSGLSSFAGVGLTAPLSVSKFHGLSFSLLAVIILSSRKLSHSSYLIKIHPSTFSPAPNLLRVKNAESKTVFVLIPGPGGDKAGIIGR